MGTRQASLLCFAASVLSLFAAAWWDAESVNVSGQAWTWRSIALLGVAAIFSCIMPVFYLALHRDASPMFFSSRLRVVIFVAAIALCARDARGVVLWIGSVGPWWAEMMSLNWSEGAFVQVGSRLAFECQANYFHFQRVFGAFVSPFACLLNPWQIRRTS